MPKIIEYPSSSFAKALELADAVDYLGGSCSVQSSADRLNKKVSGGFGMLISSAIKHGLLSRKKDELFTTDLYRDINLSYTAEEKNQNLRKAFLSPILYHKIYERFKGKELPITMLNKLVVREFNVDADSGSRIAGYFIDGLKFLELLDNNKLIDLSIEPRDEEETEATEADIVPIVPTASPTTGSFVDQANSSSYIVHIKGPGMDSKIMINEDDDLLILEAMIKKIKKKLNEIGVE